MKTTTILGIEYDGVPAPGSLAFSIWLLEQDGKHERARKLLDAHNCVNRAFGYAEHNITKDMMLLPMEGLQVYPLPRGK